MFHIRVLVNYVNDMYVKASIEAWCMHIIPYMRALHVVGFNFISIQCLHEFNIVF